MVYKNFAVLSTVVGVVVGIIAFIAGLFFVPEYAFTYALISALLTVAVCFPILIIIYKSDNLKYRRLEKELGNEIIGSIPANILTKTKSLSSKVFFTDKEIIFATFEKKKLIRDSIAFADIARIVTDGSVSIEIYMKNSSVFRLLSVSVAEILPILKKHSSNMQNEE